MFFHDILLPQILEQPRGQGWRKGAEEKGAGKVEAILHHKRLAGDWGRGPF